MLTYEVFKGQQAFSTPEEREAFFKRARGVGKKSKRAVEPGTAMKHILATNLGPWGDKNALLRDAAEIMLYELNTMLRRMRKPELTVPSTVILSCELFADTANYLVSFNQDEIDQVFTNRGGEIKSKAVRDPKVKWCVEGSFTSDLLTSALTDWIKKYQEILEDHQDHLARKGYPV